MSSLRLLTTLVLLETVFQIQVASSLPMPAYVNRTTDDCIFSSKWASCCDIQHNVTGIGTNLTNGVYSLDHYGPFSTTYGYCDLETDGGGWLVIFRRKGSFNFHRKLQKYEDGFGVLEENRTFWYGLKALSHLTNRSVWELRVDLVNPDSQVHAHYTNFSIGDTSEGYRLTVGPQVEEKSTASDSLQQYSGNMFYTWDNDGPERHDDCADKAKGGWWYTSGECGGQRGGILTATDPNLKGWYSDETGEKTVYNLIEMKIRQTNCLAK